MADGVAGLVRGLLDGGYDGATSRVMRRLTASMKGGVVARRLDELDEEVIRLQERGERLRRDNPYVVALVSDLRDELKRQAGALDSVSVDLVEGVIEGASNVQRQIALGGATDAQLASAGIGWNVPDPEAVARVLSYAEDEAFVRMLEREFVEGVSDVVANQAVRGVALGWSPLRTAREIRNKVENLPRYQAENLMRTLQLTAYRDSTAVVQSANRDIISQVIRVGTLDERTCLACVALHGTVIWDSERDAGKVVPRVMDHHSGRCTSVMRVQGRAVNITSGVDWFASLSPERQASQRAFVNSPGKLEAFRRGEVGLSDFVERYDDDTFGAMVREASLRSARR